MTGDKTTSDKWLGCHLHFTVRERDREHKWDRYGVMLTIVVPMAGAGSRFAREGFADPKPLIPVNGVPMIKVVIDNLTPAQPHRFVFVVQAKHVEAYRLKELLEGWAPGCYVVEIDGVTDGAARTVLAADALIDNQEPLMIANSDQFIDASIDDYLDAMTPGVSGLIMTMVSDDPKWSFARVDSRGWVVEVVEKVVVSDLATVGIYNFAHGSDFVWAARSMIEQNLLSNGEFYVAPTYNLLSSRGAQITTFNIGHDGAGMHGLGTPEDLAKFLALPISASAGQR